MPRYRINFAYDVPFRGHSVDVEAPTLEDAIQAAYTRWDDEGGFGEYEMDSEAETYVYNIVEVEGPEDAEVEKEVLDSTLPEQWHFRVGTSLASDPLYQAAKQVLANWEKGDLAAAVRELQAAVDHAEGKGK